MPLSKLSVHERAVQVPNFILAAPVLLMSASGCAAYGALTWRRGLGLAWLLRALCGQSARKSSARGYGADAVAPYVLHWTFATAAAALVLHVQVNEPSCLAGLVLSKRCAVCFAALRIRPLASSLAHLCLVVSK